MPKLISIMQVEIAVYHINTMFYVCNIVMKREYSPITKREEDTAACFLHKPTHFDVIARMLSVHYITLAKIMLCSALNNSVPSCATVCVTLNLATFISLEQFPLSCLSPSVYGYL